MLHHHYLPMLLVPNQEEDSWSAYNAIHNNNLKLKLSLLYSKRFNGSSLGWLVVVNEDYTITLHKPYYFISSSSSSSSSSNPLTTHQVSLPCLLPPTLSHLEAYLEEDEYFDDNEDYYYAGKQYYVNKALITASPLLSNNYNNECIVVVIYGKICELACIRYGKDTTWTKIKDNQFDKEFEDVAYYKGKFYALTFNGTLVCFEYPNPNAEITTISMELVIAPNLRRLRGDLFIRRYLVVSSFTGELLCVEREVFWNEDGYDERITKNFRVLKLDLDGDNRCGKWLEKKSLGDIVLFVGDNSSIVVLASEFNIQPNCIYFTHDEIFGLPTKTDRNCDLGVYNLDDQSFNFNYNLPSTIFHRILKRPPIWIEPPISSIYVNQ
ncbi:hypothetical protein CsatA_003595 [Cannabis sativa]